VGTLSLVMPLPPEIDSQQLLCIFLNKQNIIPGHVRMISTSSGVALYTVATPENVVPKSTAITILSSREFWPSMVVDRERVVLVIIGILLLDGLGWFMVMFRCYRTWRRCSRSSAQGVMGRMAAQLSTERPIARTTRQQHNPLLMRRLRRWAGFVHTKPVCQGRSQFREGQRSSIPSFPWTIDTALLDHAACSRGFLNNNAAAFRHSDMEFMKHCSLLS
jgi:hypothetical protein